MKKYIDKTISFFASAMRSSAPESSKRLFGAIGFITAIIYIAIWERELTETLLYVSSALLGLGSITRIFKKK